MKLSVIAMGLMGMLITAGCQAHKPDQMMVVKNGHNHKKVILIDSDHKRTDYRIIYTKPKNQSVCKKHKKHWHCSK